MSLWTRCTTFDFLFVETKIHLHKRHTVKLRPGWMIKEISYSSLFSMFNPQGVSQAEALKEENDSLRCQLDAYRNEVELLKQEQGKNQPMRSEEDNTHSQQLSFLQQALQGMQKVL